MTTKNKYGHLQAFDEDGCEVCDQCNCLYINHGAGTSCERCQSDELVECEHNYQEGI